MACESTREVKMSCFLLLKLIYLYTRSPNNGKSNSNAAQMKSGKEKNKVAREIIPDIIDINYGNTFYQT